MIRETWCFWLILIFFGLSVINLFWYAAGKKVTYTLDEDLTGRMMGIVSTIIILVIYAIALGWI